MKKGIVIVFGLMILFGMVYVYAYDFNIPGWGDYDQGPIPPGTYPVPFIIPSCNAGNTCFGVPVEVIGGGEINSYSTFRETSCPSGAICPVPVNFNTDITLPILVTNCGIDSMTCSGVIISPTIFEYEWASPCLDEEECDLVSFNLGFGPKDIMFKMSSLDNAHGEVWNGTGDYPVKIIYSQIFGKAYSGNDAYNCTGTNRILRLSGITNAHAQSPYPTSTSYPIDVCYGNIQCRYVLNNVGCNSYEQCVVTLSSETNAHLGPCSALYPFGAPPIIPYSNKICCSITGGYDPNIPELPCTQYTNKTWCWNRAYQNCTWTPIVNITTGVLINTTAQGGGCCNKGQKWDSLSGCSSTDTTICTIPFRLPVNQFNNNLYSSSGPLNNNTKKYCEQVIKEVNYGYWEPVITY